MAAQRPEELMLDDNAVSLALKAPLPARVTGTTGGRPPGGKYRLEDRLNGAGILGSIAPPPEFALRAMRPTFPPKPSSKRAIWLLIALVAATAATTVVVYRDMNRPAAVSEPISEAP